MRSLPPALGVFLLGACATVSYPFPNRAPMAVDHDRHPFRGEPAELFTPPTWGMIDGAIFGPWTEMWAFEPKHEAMNVTSIDEVADSSWFTNRVAALTPDDVARGACRDRPPPQRPWRVIRKKGSGSRLGFIVRSADDRVFFARIDEAVPEHATAADAIATRLIWAAGYETPCNYVELVVRDELVLAPEVEGEDAPTEEYVEDVLQHATHTSDGRLRMSLSERLEGRAIGGWQFWSTRGDDPNDVVPHEHRREVRGMVVLSAWLNHVDSRSENNLDTWIETGGGLGYVQHHVLDASDSLGVVWQGSDVLSQSLGISRYLDMQFLVEDWLTLGLLDRPYRLGPDERGYAHVLGYYDVERFDPDGWRNGYMNPAFERATERDRAWMARILARLGRDDIEAAVETGRFSRALYSGELARILMGRRDTILERYLTRLSPLADPVVEDGALCMADLMVTAGVREEEERRYEAMSWRGWPARADARLAIGRRDDRVCVALPSAPSSAGAPTYWIVDVVASTAGGERAFPARVHLYQLGPRRYRVVGLERPDHSGPPV